VGLDSGLCLQGHTKWDVYFSTFVGVYQDDNIFGVVVRDKSFYSRSTISFGFPFCFLLCLMLLVCLE
jgi:hypothetical protein